MSATPLIPLFAAVTLLFGGANQLSAQLIIAGVLAITTHAAFSPANLSSPYPNFEIYHPKQPPLRDYVLVFGLASLLLVTLISRVRQLPWSLVIAIRRKSAGPQTTTPLNSSSTLLDSSTHHLIQHTPQSRPSLYSTSSTSTDRWTATASTLAGGSPTLIHRPTGDHSLTSSSEIAALKARMSQLETALEEMKRRSDASTASQKDTASGTTTVVAELSPSHTPPPFLDLDATVPPRTPSPSPPPVDPTSFSKPVDVHEHLRSFLVFLAEETKQTDQLILKMRNILHANGEVEDISVPPTSSSTQSLLPKHLPPSSSADSITPYSPPSPSSSLEILRTPSIRRARDALPLPSVVDRLTGTPEFNLTLDLSGFSKVSCSTPVRSANEVEHSTSPSPSSFLNALRSDLVPQALFVKPAPKRSERADAGIRPFSRATSILTRLSPRSTTPRSTYSPLSRLRERSSKSLSLPLTRLGDEPSLGSRGSTKAKKQRFIDAFKTLLDIAKESSDVFPPLKGCLGGISALIKHYEEYSDVKDKLNDLAPWVKKLSVTLAQANPKDDHDEVERRSELAKELEEIGLQSMALLAKGKTARVLDKTRDSGEVVKLVERLRQATLVYQVSQQKSIHDKLSQITSSFDALTMSQKSSVEKKIEAVRARLDRLKVDWNVTSNAEELKRRMGLYEALEGIGAKLQLISEQPGATEDAVKEQSTNFAGDLADDLRDVIVEYQFSQQNAIYKQNRKLINAAELSVLNSCHRAKGAEFRHDNRQGCLKGTREDVLDEIESWSRDFDMSPVYWLNGLAGTGKSTIAQTIAERIFADGRLGASFFCSRDFKDRRDLRFILPTLAFQLAHNYPDFRSIIVPLLQSNPDIAHEVMYNQMETLIVEPLSSLGISTVIVIDALDECADEDPQSAILSVMGRLVGEIPKVKFLITGRPEPRIQSGFRLGLLRPLTDVFVLHEVEPSIVNTDIRLFFKHGLCELAKRTGVDQDIWPADQHLDLLCERAGGLFVYAVATLKFLDHRFTPPNKQLDIIIQTPGSTAYEGNARVKPSTTLDSLYLASFQSAFIGLDTKADETIRLVVGAVVLAINPLPPSAIATLINLGKQEVMNILRLIHSLLKLPEDPASEVLPFHKSFPDFITNPHRCPDTRFYISPPASHLKLAWHCLMLMNNNLEWNLLSLPNYALNSEVMDLEERVGNHISCALQYACRSWHHHLSEATEDITAIIPVLQSFLQDGFLAWLEVLSVIGASRDAITALEKLIPWLWKVARDHHLLKTARDYSQFITNFFEVINASATHIYHSALELSPLSSIIRKNYYYKQQHNSPRVVVGVEDAWKPTSATSTKNSYYMPFTWSPSGYLLAVVAKEGVEIWDALTLKLLSTLHSSKATAEFRCGLAYSPDGHSLATCFDASIVVWDTQTGGEVTKIHCEVASNGLELVWSLDGKSICAVSPKMSGNITVHTYDTVSGKALSLDVLQTSRTRFIWACGKFFHIATTAQDHRNQIINIFEVGSTLAKIESFPLPPSASLNVISPATYRASLEIPGNHNHQPELLILSFHNSEVLLRARGSYWHSNFSPGADLFAAFGRDYLSIWKYTSGHYVHWREFQQTPGPLQFSPSSSSILVCSGVLLRVLNLDHFTTLHTANSPVAPQSQPLDAFSPNGTFIATAHHGSNTIKITNLSCQIPTLSQFIDTELEISAMVLTGKMLLVKGSDKIVAWLLTEAGPVDGIKGNTSADKNDSLWEILLPLQAPDAIHGTSRDEKTPRFYVKEEIAAISMYGFVIHAYHIETGDVIKPTEASKLSKFKWYYLDNNQKNGCIKYYHDLYKHQGAPDYDWPISQATLQQEFQDNLLKQLQFIHTGVDNLANNNLNNTTPPTHTADVIPTLAAMEANIVSLQEKSLTSLKSYANAAKPTAKKNPFPQAVICVKGKIDNNSHSSFTNIVTNLNKYLHDHPKHSHVCVVGVKWTASSNLVVRAQAPSPTSLVSALKAVQASIVDDQLKISDIIPNVRWSQMTLSHVFTSKDSDSPAFSPEAIHDTGGRGTWNR
ncbi:hypothetical protein BJ322DRAFT_1105154 [Thelephora terrestris]|uniref:NACHT domain-containing protein n=1 Tax=Thelephora terrestris TaxID=56493 RepID=A0A9P6HNH1_9AGAM|nr:hypothetical protein BJ322DRAFT_1105154 [Thelephora terrestris]